MAISSGCCGHRACSSHFVLKVETRLWAWQWTARLLWSQSTVASLSVWTDSSNFVFPFAFCSCLFINLLCHGICHQHVFSGFSSLCGVMESLYYQEFRVSWFLTPSWWGQGALTWAYTYVCSFLINITCPLQDPAVSPSHWGRIPVSPHVSHRSPRQTYIRVCGQVAVHGVLQQTVL